MDYRVLGKTDLKVSSLGFGASPLGSMFSNVPQAEATAAVYTAIENGINFFDVSPFYGSTRAETALGIALKNIPREDYYLSTKVGRYGATDFDFSPQRVVASVDESLQRLNVDYVDLILCHDIEFGSLDQIINETFPALHKVRASGKVRYIGVSGLPLNILRYVAERIDLDVILSYCHYCLNDSSLTDLLPFLKEKQISIINASPLSMGLLTENNIPVWHPASNELRACCAAAARHCRSKGVDIAQLALQFTLSNTDITTTLVGIASKDQMNANIQSLSQPLDQALLAEVLDILKPVHNQTWPSGKPENMTLGS